MSTRVVLIWLAVAIVLGGVAIYLFQTRPGPREANGAGPLAGGERIVSFVPGDLERIELKAPDRAREIIVRDAGTPGSTGWVLRLDRAPATTGGVAVPSAQGSVDWPLLESRMQGFIQKLLDTRAVETPDRDTPLAQGSVMPSVLRLVMKDGSATQISVAGRTVGGLGMVEVTRLGEEGADKPQAAPQRALIDSWLHQVISTPGPRAWRDTTAMRLAGADVSRVTLSSGGKKIALGRVSGKWGMREPAVAPADSQAVVRLLQRLRDVKITSFLDDGSAGADTRLDQPIASVTLEYDARRVSGDTTLAESPSASVETVTNSLVVGGAAAIGPQGADRVYARIDSGGSERVVMVDAKALAELSMDPGDYLWRHPTTASKTDIGTILVEMRSPDGGSVDVPPGQPSNQRVFRKQLDQWQRVDDAGNMNPVVDQAARSVDELLEFVTGTGAGEGAAAISIEAPTRFVQFGRLTLLSLGSSELEQVDIGEAGSGLITFKTGPVYRTYTEDRVPAIIADLRARAKVAGLPIEGLGGGQPVGPDESPTK